MPETTLYQAALAAGIKTDGHESDLYLADGPEARGLLHDFGKHGSAKLFISAVDGRFWWDVPFAFDPFWERKTR